jgi:hypothetical protein
MWGNAEKRLLEQCTKRPSFRTFKRLYELLALGPYRTWDDSDTGQKEPKNEKSLALPPKPVQRATTPP